MYTGIIAIPTLDPGGLEASRSDHFGHCPVFTLIFVQDGAPVQVTTLENVPHQAGGCMAPVAALQDRGVSALVVGGMGAGPFKRCTEAGIAVSFAARGQYPDVRSTLSAFLDGALPAMLPDLLCRASSGQCHGHRHEHGH